MLIGVSGLAQSGKSTVARRVSARFGLQRHAFADPLKGMLATVGFTHAQLYGEEKSTLMPEFGKTPREVMISLGTGWARRMVHREFWIRAWGRTIPVGVAGIIADDVRFANEARAIRDRGGYIIRVVNPRVRPLARWGALGRFLVRLGFKFPIEPSERVDRVPCDAVIINDGSLADLERLVDDTIQRLLGRHVAARAAEVAAERARKRAA